MFIFANGRLFRCMVTTFNSTECRLGITPISGLSLYNIYRTCPACIIALIYIYGDNSLLYGAGSEHTNRTRVYAIIVIV